jgi:hypothetical protein
MDEMTLRDVALKVRAVDQQHPAAFAGQQHGRRGTGAAGADHNHVVPAFHRFIESMSTRTWL